MHHLMKSLFFLLLLVWSGLLSSCTGPSYQTTAIIITSLGQSAASVLSARYQGYQTPASGGYGGGAYDYGQQQPSQGYDMGYQNAGYSNAGYYQQQMPQQMPVPFGPPPSFY